MYIWRKRATADWLWRQDYDLERRFGSALAIIERPGKARALVEVCCQTGAAARRVQREFGGTIEKLRPDWLEQLTAEKRTLPLRIGSRLIVDQACAPGPKGVRTIVIPAEAAFGTGEHATTAMCLRMLERVTRKLDVGWSMLDAGTGSGILALAGSCFGADRIVAIDNDRRAVVIAERNAKANRIYNIEFRTGDVLKPKFRQKFNLIAANLFSEILAAALPLWKRSLAGDGQLILSGVLRFQERSLVASLRQNGFVALEIRRRGKWIALLAARRTAQRAVPSSENS